MKRSARVAFASALVIATLPLAALPSAAVTKVVQARTTTSTPLPSTTSPTSLQSVTLASGQWTVIGKAFVVDFTSSETDYFRCELFRSTTAKHFDVSAGWVGNDVHATMITNLAKLKVDVGTTATIEQRCWHDHSGIANASVDPGATLLAVTAPSAGQNRMYRSRASLPVSSTTLAASLGVTTGTWVYGFKATAVNVGSDADIASCFIPGTGIDQSVGTSSSLPRVATLTAFGVLTVNTSTTITVNCQADQGGPVYLDAGLALWARQVPSAVTGDSCGTVLGATSTSGAVADMRAGLLCTIKSGTGASQVGGDSITPGTWVVLGAEQTFTEPSSGNSYVGLIGCRATNPGTNKVLDAHASLWLPFTGSFLTYATTTYLGKVTTNVDTAVEFRCGLPSGVNATASSYAGGYVVFKP